MAPVTHLFVFLQPMAVVPCDRAVELATSSFEPLPRSWELRIFHTHNEHQTMRECLFLFFSFSWISSAVVCSKLSLVGVFAWVFDVLRGPLKTVEDVWTLQGAETSLSVPFSLQVVPSSRTTEGVET